MLRQIFYPSNRHRLCIFRHWLSIWGGQRKEKLSEKPVDVIIDGSIFALTKTAVAVESAGSTSDCRNRIEPCAQSKGNQAETFVNDLFSQSDRTV